MNPQLEDLFAKIKTEADIRTRFVSAKQTETNYIEFKEKSDRETPALGETDRKNFSRALSAFSNSDGGLLVWGIRTRKKEGKDVASAVRPIKGVEDFAERLRDSLLNTLMPQNPKVQIEAVANRLGNGYVKCMIPASDNPPHRAMADREYWVRLDGRNVRLEHYVIRDLMSRRASPELQLHIITDPSERKFEERIFEDPSDGELLALKFRIINVGRAIAKHAGWFATIQNAKIAAAERCADQSEANSAATATWDARGGIALHPNGTYSDVGYLLLSYVNKSMPGYASETIL